MEKFIFLEILAALWLVGSALAIGLYISRKNTLQGSLIIGYAWSLIFSWAFVGWLAGELIALALKPLRTAIWPCRQGLRKNHSASEKFSFYMCETIRLT